MRKSLGVCVFFSELASSPCLADPAAQGNQSGPAAEQSFKDVIAQGFDIKGMTSAQTNNGVEIYVALQKGTKVAVCAFNAKNWSYLNNDTIADTKVCDVRTLAP
jgi:hypothetical protein